MPGELKKWVEYDKTTGKILSVLKATAERALSYETETTGFLEVPAFFRCAHELYAVRDGKIVKAFETDWERERAERETLESAVREIRKLALKLGEALLFDDAARAVELRAQAAPLRKYYTYMTGM
jgi:hypothetical protein